MNRLPRRFEAEVSWKASVLLFGSLAALQLWLFGPSLKFFFQGDSLYWLYHRYRGWRDFGSAFLDLDSYGWFRPLAHASIPSLFYPFFGTEPAGYHAIVLLVFVSTTWVVFRFIREFSGRWLTAALATFYFGVHSTHVFVTFDHAFEPELVLGLFSILSAFSYIRWTREGGTYRYWFSVVFLACSLLSKESGVSLPLILLLIGLFHDTSSPVPAAGFGRAVRAICNLSVHWLVLGLYLAWSSLIVRDGLSWAGLPGGSYRLDFGTNSVENLVEAVLLALNMPLEAGRDSGMYLLFAGLLAAGLLLAVTGMAIRRSPERREVLFGLVWFLVASLPALPLTDFKAYYLYVPMMGGALVFGSAGSWVYREWLSRTSRPFRILGWVPLILIVLGNRETVSRYRQDHLLLGTASRISERAIADVESLSPGISPATTLFLIDDPEDKLGWHYAGGSLFKLFLGDSVEILFASAGSPAPEGRLRRGAARALRYHQGHLVDVTEEFLARPDRFRQIDEVIFREGEALRLEVEPPVISRGAGSYRLRLEGAANQDVLFLFSRDDGPETYFRTRLDAEGQAGFFVSSATEPGVYRFVGVRLVRDEEWTRVEPVTLRVE